MAHYILCLDIPKLEDTQGRRYRKHQEERPSNNSNGLFGQVLGDNRPTGNGDPRGKSVGRNGSTSNTHWILCRGKCNGGKEGTISEFGRKHQPKNT
jgi:hypothetical protein